MSKKEKFKKFIKENKYEIIGGCVTGVIGGIIGLAFFESGEKFALNSLAKAVTKQCNESLKEGEAPVNYKFIGNMFKGFTIINTES